MCIFAHVPFAVFSSPSWDFHLVVVWDHFYINCVCVFFFLSFFCNFLFMIISCVIYQTPSKLRVRSDVDVQTTHEPNRVPDSIRSCLPIIPLPPVCYGMLTNQNTQPQTNQQPTYRRHNQRAREEQTASGGDGDDSAWHSEHVNTSKLHAKRNTQNVTKRVSHRRPQKRKNGNQICLPRWMRAACASSLVSFHIFCSFKPFSSTLHSYSNIYNTQHFHLP